MEDGFQPHADDTFTPDVDSPDTVPSHSTLEFLRQEARYDELLAQAKRLVDMLGRESRNRMVLKRRVDELQDKMASSFRQAEARVAQMLGKRFSEMKPSDIPIFDPRFRVLLWFSEYQGIMSKCRGDVTMLSKEDFARLRKVADDMRAESMIELRAKYGNVGGHSARGADGKAVESRKGTPATRWAKGTPVPQSVEVSPEFAKEMGMTESE